MVQSAFGALDELLLIVVPIIVFRLSYGLARGRKSPPKRKAKR